MRRGQSLATLQEFNVGYWDGICLPASHLAASPQYLADGFLTDAPIQAWTGPCTTSRFMLPELLTCQGKHL